MAERTSTEAIVTVLPLAAQWQTLDPFLFCVHHKDAYPAGTRELGVASERLAGRNLGADFSGKDGWSMYHGQVVPGFPRHPHRGFETVTLARRGFVDHSDSLGAEARFGEGDVQWMTAGKGICHSEMFPLLNAGDAAENPTELFQIWLNLPSTDKLVDPHFKMLWASAIPKITVSLPGAPLVEVTLIAGRLGEATPPSPPPNSWASRDTADVGIWTIRLDSGGEWDVPPGPSDIGRVFYFFEGSELQLDGQRIERGNSGQALQVRPDSPLTIKNPGRPAELLMLQGRPIGEPVAQHGPFVMNTKEELRQTFGEYRQTEFGGWRWSVDDPVHTRSAGRFARHGDGRVDVPD